MFTYLLAYLLYAQIVLHMEIVGTTIAARNRVRALKLNYMYDRKGIFHGSVCSASTDLKCQLVLLNKSFLRRTQLETCKRFSKSGLQTQVIDTILFLGFIGSKLQNVDGLEMF